MQSKTNLAETILTLQSLRLSQQSQSDVTVRQVINLLASDVNRFDAMLDKFHFLWVGPIQVLIALGILLWTVGPSSLIGIGIVFLFNSLQSNNLLI